MSAGMAIVTSAGTGCEDVIGDAGLLVRYGDVDGLRAALARLLASADERARCGARARQRLLERFAWRTVVQQYLAAYRRCSGGRWPADRPAAAAARREGGARPPGGRRPAIERPTRLAAGAL